MADSWGRIPIALAKSPKLAAPATPAMAISSIISPSAKQFTCWFRLRGRNQSSRQRKCNSCNRLTWQKSWLSSTCFAILSHHSVHQIAELVGGELIAFNVADQYSLAINDGSMQGMVHQTFIREKVHSEHTGYPPDIRDHTGEKMPRVRVCLTSVRVAS